MTHTPQPIKESTNVHKRTLQLRNKFLKDQISMACGGSQQASTKQTGILFKSFTPEIRQEILKSGEIKPIEIQAEQLVSMKANLSLPWEKMKVLGR